MNISARSLGIGISFAAMAVVLGAAYLQGGEREEGRGEKIAMSQLPAPVKATIDREGTGGTIKEIEKITDGGRTVYGADIVTKGKEQEVVVGEDGTVIERGRKEDDD